MSENSKDELGDRMKEYETAEAGRRLLGKLPVLARIDGKCFSSFTRGLRRPYDTRLSCLMIETTRALVKDSGAIAGYTQSDEISLLFYSEDPKSQIFLDRRIQKMASILASMATGAFNAMLPQRIPERVGRTALFDCRVWAVPTKEEAANTFLWRELDATKNSISMAARTVYSHKQLFGKSGSEMQEMLFQKGINWDDYPAFFKRGTFILRREVERRFSTEEMEKLPPLHEARRNPSLVVRRSDVVEADMMPFRRVANRVGVLFDNEAPLPIVEKFDAR